MLFRGIIFGYSYFLFHGMHCLGCGASRGETVEEACAVHGVDVEKLLKLVNEEANKAQ